MAGEIAIPGLPRTLMCVSPSLYNKFSANLSERSRSLCFGALLSARYAGFAFEFKRSLIIPSVDNKAIAASTLLQCIVPATIDEGVVRLLYYAVPPPMYL